jgi:phosphatidylglycerophosphate synthase
MIPAAQMLIAFRAACAPLIFVLACFGFPGPLLAAVVAAALISDVADGAVARRAGTTTPGLRYADTIVDTIFYVSAAAALWIAVPGAFEGASTALVILITVHVSRGTFELTKFGRLASYHMWSSKALGLLLAGALVSGFATGERTALLTCALWVGIANELEGFAASAVLPAWRTDIPSVLHAIRSASAHLY